jgi:hypothetical protein
MREVRTKGMIEGGDEKESEREMRGDTAKRWVRERRHEWGEGDAASGSVASRAKLGRERREEKKKV